MCIQTICVDLMSVLSLRVFSVQSQMQLKKSEKPSYNDLLCSQIYSSLLE